MDRGEAEPAEWPVLLMSSVWDRLKMWRTGIILATATASAVSPLLATTQKYFATDVEMT